MVQVTGPTIGGAFIGLFILALVGGVLATVVYAIAKNKPGVILWTGGLLLLMLVGGVTLPFFAYRSVGRSTTWTAQPPDVQWSTGIPGPNSDWADGGSSWAETSVRAGQPVWLMLLLIVALVVGGLLLLSKWLRPNPHAERVAGHRGEWHDDDRPRRGGWGWVLAMFIVVPVVLTLFALLRARVRPVDVAELQQRARVQMELSRRQAERSFGGIVDEFARPRITIEAPIISDAPHDTSAAAATGAGDQRISLEEAERMLQVDEPADKAQSDDSDGADGNAENTPAEDSASEGESGSTPSDAADNADATPAPASAVTNETVSAADETQSRRRGDQPAVAKASAAAAVAPRPAWVDQPPQRSGDRWSEVVVAGDYATDQECIVAADRLLYVATWKHLQTLLGRSLERDDWPQIRTNDGRLQVLSGDSRKVQVYNHAYNELSKMDINLIFIRREIVPLDGEYMETVELQRTFSPMKRLYTRLVFTPEVDAQLRDHWRRTARGDRVAVVGLMGGVLVSVVGLAYGLLTLDTWTKGYYTKRLFIGVPAVIIGILWLLVLAVS